MSAAESERLASLPTEAIDEAAGLIVVDRNILEIDPHSLIDTKVVYTVFAGKIVYDASARTSTALLPGRRQGRLR